MSRNLPKYHTANTPRSRCSGGAYRHRRTDHDSADCSNALQPADLTRIQRLRCLAHNRCCALSDKQRFTLGLIGARLKKSGLTARISDDEWHLLNEIEARLFDLDDSDPPELSL